MKKRLITILAGSTLLMAGVSGNLLATPKASAVNASDYTETIYWGIDGEGCLKIGTSAYTDPSFAKTGSFAGNYPGQPSWQANEQTRNLIKKVHFDNKIVPATCAKWFQMDSNLTEIENFELLNTGHVTSFAYMFYSSKKLQSLDLSSFNTSNVTSMLSMFEDCLSLTSINFGGWNVESVTDFSRMFTHCSKVTTLDLSSFKTTSGEKFTSMFQTMSEVTSIDVSNFDLTNVTNMASMFSGCGKLEALDLSK